ncbi:hypothetical protein [Azospirillum sp.]|uniref:DUF4376 domain-containing protein n=1 Tax=Azospirillum sp. TaxID=34012 RepID=UPI002D44D249|nr:hypothetical protein [Azospirillum sp.]HYF87434.1 hypothetical protein [Azospirillum sp.]
MLPAAIVADNRIIATYYTAEPITYGDGDDAINHPREVWVHWTREDWAAMCPSWRVLPLIDTPPSGIGKRVERLPQDEWVVGAGAVAVAYRLLPLTAHEETAQAAEARTKRVAEINAERDRRLAEGAPYQTKRIDVSDRGRADLGGMAIAAVLAQSGTVPWTEGYSTGWITMDNTRLPLPTPAAGLALSAAVGDWYGRMMQFARDLKDEVLTSPDPDAVSIANGWPE